MGHWRWRQWSKIKVITVILGCGRSSSCDGGETGHVLVLSVAVIRAAVTVIESSGGCSSGKSSGSIKEGREGD